MNQMQNWLHRNSHTSLRVKRSGTKQSLIACDRTIFPDSFSRIFATFAVPPNIILCSFILLTSTPVQAQINPDNTLGAESSSVTPNVLINGASADRIDGGALRGSNLFHSFTQFNINDGQRVYFGNPAGVQNIFTRVTGGQSSNILGTLGVNGTANLFLINPNGIVFGKNASLDVRGSFVGTTANAVQFGNQGIFSATNPQAAPLLTINPSALLFNQLNQTGITNQSQAPAGINPVGDNVTGLRVADSQNLLLVGGNLNIDGGGLLAYGGNIELAAVAAPATVGLNIAANNLPSLTIPDGVERADVSLSNGAEVNVRGADGGNIKINGRNVNLAGESKLRAGIETGLGTANSQGGDVEINATGTTTLTDSSFISNSVRDRAFGKSGDVKIATGSLNLDKDAVINVSTLGQGDAGNIFIQADGVSLGSNTGIYSSVTYGAIGNGGSVNIKANSLNISDNAAIETNVLGAYQEFPVGRGNGGNINVNVGSLSLNQGIINASTSGQGNAGNVSIQTKDAVSLTNGAGIYSYVDEGAVGNGGSIKIQAGSLSLIKGSEIDTRTFGQGNGGKITVNASEAISLDGFGNDSNLFTRIISAVGNSGVGKAGDIELTAGNVALTNDAYVSSSTLDKGDAGNIIINARDTISFNNYAYANSIVAAKAVGNGGDIQVKTGTLLLTNGGQISTNVLGQGNAGNITVEASDTVKLDGFITREFDGDLNDVTSGLSSILLIGGVGKAGDIQLKTKSLFVTNGASLTTSTSGTGDAGNITINASDRVTFAGFSGKSLFNSQASSIGNSQSVGNGGDISINTGTLLFQNGGSLVAFNSGQGNGGNIFVDAANTITFDGIGKSGLPSSASTYATNGDAGSIQAKTGALFLTNGGYISAVGFGLGKAGDIKIDARNSVKVDGAIRDVTLFNGSVADAESGLLTSLLRGEGKGGDIEITTGSLTVSNRGILSSSTSAKGNAGNITINARDTVTFDNVGNAYSVALDNAIGNSGNIRINTGTLFLTNGGTVNTFSAGQGNAGNIFINTRDRVFVDGVGSKGMISGAYSFTTNSGNGGEIQVNTGTLSLSNGGILNAATFGKGNAGDITINARDLVTIEAFDVNGFTSGVFTTVENQGEGKGGDINLTTGSLSVLGGLISSTSLAKGDAGNITINARDTITLDGAGRGNIITPESIERPSNFSGIFSSVTNRGTGKAGDTKINAGDVRIADKAGIAAATFAGDGGNITLDIGDLLLLRSGGFISTTAGNAQAGGDGGNITINSPFIVAAPNENSDITANAFTGKGGNVNITTQNIFGIQASSQLTSFSDITASSQLGVQGQISITQPSIQPTQGLVELPEQVLDASSQIAQICPKPTAKHPLGKFIITGRGGSLPPTSLEPLAGTTSLSPLASLDGENADGEIDAVRKSESSHFPSSPNFRYPKVRENPSQIVEAQALIKTANGNIALVAQAPTATPSATRATPACVTSIRNYESLAESKF